MRRELLSPFKDEGIAVDGKTQRHNLCLLLQDSSDLGEHLLIEDQGLR